MKRVVGLVAKVAVGDPVVSDVVEVPVVVTVVVVYCAVVSDAVEVFVSDVVVGGSLVVSMVPEAGVVVEDRVESVVFVVDRVDAVVVAGRVVAVGTVEVFIVVGVVG